VTVTLDGETLTPADVVAVVRDHEPVAVADDARERVRTARERVEDVLDSGEAVYGLNTGFGELVNERIPPERVADLQTNLLRSHAAGSGRECTTEEVRAMLVTRVNALVKGHSGIRERVVDHLVRDPEEGIEDVRRLADAFGQEPGGEVEGLARAPLDLLAAGDAVVAHHRRYPSVGRQARTRPAVIVTES